MSNKKKLDLKEKDYLVYPVHGIGVLEKITLDQESSEKIYHIKFVESQMMVTIPENSLTEMNIRKTINKSEIKKVIDDLAKPPQKSDKHWRIRFKETFDKLKTGDIHDTALIAKELFVRGSYKPLSMIERKQFETSFGMLVREISISTKSPEEEVYALLSSKLQKLTNTKE